MQIWRKSGDILLKICMKNPAAANNLVADVEEAIKKRLEMPELFQKYHSKKERENPYYRIKLKYEIM